MATKRFAALMDGGTEEETKVRGGSGELALAFSVRQTESGKAVQIILWT